MAGEFSIGTFTKTESTAQAVQVIFDVIKSLQDTPPTDAELNDMKSYIAGSFVRSRETPQSVAGDLWLIESQRLGNDYLDKLLSTVASTTKQQCVDFVKKNVDPDKMAIVIAGDASKIKEELEKIAPVTVVGE
jgi:predicted Zn-dependent peptidase